MTKGVELGAQQGLQQGIQQGLQQGLTAKQGAELNCIELVCKKLAKGYSVREISDMLEEEEAYIQRIVDIAEMYAPEYNRDKIYKDLYAGSKK